MDVSADFSNNDYNGKCNIVTCFFFTFLWPNKQARQKVP